MIVHKQQQKRKRKKKKNGVVVLGVVASSWNYKAIPELSSIKSSRGSWSWARGSSLCSRVRHPWRGSCWKSLVKLLFSSLNYTWISFFVPELWKICFLSLNFEKVHFYTWISSLDYFIKKKKFMCKNKLFENSGTKNELFKV